jgi:hypothetical protein
MTDETIPSTKLDAVNLMLMSIGQTPLNTLDTTGIRDAALAELTLDMQTRQVLSRGWSFNTDIDFEVAPDVSNNVLVPADALQMIPMLNTYNYVDRNNSGTRMMYDRDENTFTITDTIEYRIVRAFQFVECPETMRGYLMTRSARIFQTQIVGSKILREYTKEDELDAFAALKRHERRNKKMNIFRTGTDSNQIIQRNFIPSRY